MTLYKWSRLLPEANATADSSINWQEGQAPSSINDSARGMMFATAKYRDDVAGAIVTGGTSTAYTVASYQAFGTLAQLNGQTIAFTPHATNGATVTLNVDGLGPKPLRSAPSTELLSGMLVQGTPYTCTYSHADAVFYLRDFHVSPYSVPLGSCIDYFGVTAPNSTFALAYGQAISRTAYAALFGLFSTTYGSGDSSTTFNIPDLRGRVVAGKDDMGGLAASRLTSSYFGASAASLGGVGGTESKILITANLPPYTPAGTVSVTSTTGNILASNGPPDNWSSIVGATSFNNQFKTSITSTGSLTGTAQGGMSTPVSSVQPTIIANKLVRIL